MLRPLSISDLASSLLAKQLGADMLIIATDVPYVAINYGKPDQKFERAEPSRSRKYLNEGQFGKGMGPKVQATLLCKIRWRSDYCCTF